MSSSHSNSAYSLLSDPFLQFPTESSVKVVWFTEFQGRENKIIYGQNLDKEIIAKTTELSRTREDEQSKVKGDYSETTRRQIWRHEGEITGLKQGEKVPYKVVTLVKKDKIESNVFSLASSPKKETPLKILLTSDHQLKPMVAANLQKVVETIGKVDAIFLAGDLVNIPDRASEWFDDQRGGAFFPCLQGLANYTIENEDKTTVYHGGQLIQSAPLFPTIGNHEVMGKWSETKRLSRQFVDAIPREVAENLYSEKSDSINPNHDNNFKESWIKNNSFNTDTYEEIFSFPQTASNNSHYYAVTFGDIRLVVLQVTNIWRSPSLEKKVTGRYQEAEKDFDNPENWGYGQHIFKPIEKGSEQYQWLKNELKSEAFQQAKYKIVMFHHPVHTLGGNIVPAYTNPIQKINKDTEGNITEIRYEYPKENDYIIRDLMPLLETAKVDLVFYGHSHLWNRFISSNGINFLESSNVGNSYGAHLGNNKRQIPPDYSPLNYVEIGDPNGLKPIIPNLAPLTDENNNPLPYIASNEITVFSILDTEKGTVSSYYFDTRKPNSNVIKFDEFAI
ncbi:metallophosphoesterase [Cyanothece sp. BG0011]|uniref:metallophosphoesterase family protein n=1 Tax=Cyanothece sp. BG0011 TaxID=2082950 RepID=UPI000D1EF1F4|nr:metallophosphoesterase [Cyanothece sp. BG0011]